MTEYWIISAPGDKTCQQTFDKMNAVTSKQNNLSDNYKFHVPDLKVGTLDLLVGSSDELVKLDTNTEGITRKLASYLGEVLEDQKDKLEENLVVNGMELQQYLTRFGWDMAKYPVKQPLDSIISIINKQIGQIDTELKAKASAYNNLKSSLQSLERKATGSLLARNLGDLVKKEHFILGSEYLVTLLVVVPKQLYNDWFKKYEKLCDMVVPRSSVKIYEDSEHGLFNVSLFIKAVDDFKENCKLNKFVVRDFQYSEEKLIAGKNEIAKLESDKKKQYSLLIRWLKVNFSEAFSAWVHVKALRVFVESVLRYGLPVNFQAMLLRPLKSQKKLRDSLNKLYSHLDTSAAQGPLDDIPGLNIGQQEYYSYVFFKININMIDSSVH